MSFLFDFLSPSISGYSLLKACFGLQIDAFDYISYSKAAYDIESCFESRPSIQKKYRATKENLTRLSEPLERVFKEASKNLIFSHQQGSIKS